MKTIRTQLPAIGQCTSATKGKLFNGNAEPGYTNKNETFHFMMATTDDRVSELPLIQKGIIVLGAKWIHLNQMKK